MKLAVKIGLGAIAVALMLKVLITPGGISGAYYGDSTPSGVALVRAIEAARMPVSSRMFEDKVGDWVIATGGCAEPPSSQCPSRWWHVPCSV